MENESFINYIGKKINIIYTIISIVSGAVTFFTTYDFYLTITVTSVCIIIMLVISFYKLYKDLKSTKELLITKSQEYDLLNGQYKQKDKDFRKQSKEYTKNINELYRHKMVTHVVQVLIDSNPPVEEETKKLIEVLKISVSKTIKEQK